MTDTLDFKCRISSGMGMYSELGFPGPGQLPDLPQDWPQALYKGSLNAAINPDGWPQELDRLGPGRGITRLDNKKFTPAFIIPQDKIANNKLEPVPQMPERGLAQVWRCTVRVEKSETEFPAWVVRRIGSAYTDIIELVSSTRLRDQFNLRDGDDVVVTIHNQKPLKSRPPKL